MPGAPGSPAQAVPSPPAHPHYGPIWGVDKTELAKEIVTRINKADRGYLAPGKMLCVRVRFTTSSGDKQVRLYNITVPAS